MKRLPLLPLLLLSTAAAPPDILTSAGEELRASHAALAPHSDGFALDGGPGSKALLDRHWAAIRRWTEAWLNGGHAAGGLAAAARRIDAGLDLGWLPLGRDSVVVTAREGEIGTAFVVRRGADGYRTAWSVSTPGAAAIAAYPVLKGWTSAGAAGRCGSSGGACRPLSGTARALPADAQGRPRFYVEAVRAQPAGATVGGQISVWRWTGMSAEPLFVGSYAFMVEQPARVSFDGRILHVGVKEEFRRFYSCGACSGRQRDWRIRIGPSAVRELGRLSRVPELDFVDELLDGLFKGRPVPPAAAGADLRPIRRQVAAIGGDPRSSDASTMGMMMGWTLNRRGREGRLCVSFDDGTDLFDLAITRAGLRLRAVRDGPAGGCGKGARS